MARQTQGATYLFPWKPPPQMTVMPAGTPMPVTLPRCGNVNSTASSGGERKGRAAAASSGRSLLPLLRVDGC